MAKWNSYAMLFLGLENHGGVMLVNFRGRGKRMSRLRKQPNATEKQSLLLIKLLILAEEPNERKRKAKNCKTRERHKERLGDKSTKM